MQSAFQKSFLLRHPSPQSRKTYEMLSQGTPRPRESKNHEDHRTGIDRRLVNQTHGSGKNDLLYFIVKYPSIDSSAAHTPFPPGDTPTTSFPSMPAALGSSDLLQQLLSVCAGRAQHGHSPVAMPSVPLWK